jgi:putative pyruvate formate lyase activating enzyme
MRFLASLSKETYISVMSQYFPANRAVGMPGMKRRITNEEYDEAVQAFHDAGLSNGWIQGG